MTNQLQWVRARRTTITITLLLLIVACGGGSGGGSQSSSESSGRAAITTMLFNATAGIARDASGNIYVAGFQSGPFDPVLINNEFVVAKYTADGTPIWTRQFGTPHSDIGTSIATDTAGNVYAAGYTEGNLANSSAANGTDILIVKYDTNGTRLWTRQVDSVPVRVDLGAIEQAMGIATDANGNVYVTGFTSGSIDGEPNPNGSALFLMKYDSAGNSLWTRQLAPPNGGAIGYGVATDTAGNIYVTGQSGDDTFLAKFDATGQVLWSKLYGFGFTDQGRGVATHPDGSIYMVGYLTLLGGVAGADTDVVVIKYDANGNRVWVREEGSKIFDKAFGVTTDAMGNIYVAGKTNNNNFGGTEDILVLKYDATGTRQWSRQIGGSQHDHALGIAVSGDLVYLSGVANTSSASEIAGSSSITVIKYDANGEAQ